MNKVLILFSSLFCLVSIKILYTHVQRSYWPYKTKTDLLSIHTSIKENHPGPVDPDADSHFVDWFESGYANALQRAELVTNWSEHMFTLLYYVNGYNDAHVRLNHPHFFKTCSIQWPGLLAEYRNGAFYVAHVAPEWDTELPPVGAEIILTNGKNPHDMMCANIFPYFGNEEFERDWVKNTPLLLLDCGNTRQEPIRSCVYKTDGTQHTITLHYKKTLYDSLHPIIKRLSGRSSCHSRTFSIKELEGNGIWISIPTFHGVNPTIHRKLEKLIAYASQVSDKAYVVFDVRGNSGGASDYAERIVRALFGDSMVTTKLGWMLDAPRSYRVSQGNIAHYKDLLQSVTAHYGSNSEAYEWVHGMLTCVENAYAENTSLCTYQPPVTHNNTSNIKQEHTYTKPVFLLTDGRCFSACLMFADMLLAFDNVVHIGLPTSGDTPYAEVRTVPIPESTMSLTIPTNIRHNLLRAYNECYIPQHRYHGDINDTDALEKWVLSLYQSMARPMAQQPIDK